MKQTIGIILFAIFFSFMGMSSFATSDTFSTQTVSSPTSSLDTEMNAIQSHVAGQTEDVTIQEAEKWAERKGFELVHLLQKVVQPFAIIIFIISAFMAMAGGFGNSQLVGRGLWGMTIAVIMYAVVLYAPEIMDSVLGWLTT
jgi:lipopolysaccharide export LptBFGC system permease protein LptF